MHNAITDVAGIRVGHHTDRVGGTGCTVVLCEEGAVGGVDVRGAAPGTRESDALRPGNLVPAVHAVMLTGGSAFGLDAAAGIMEYLAERGRGFTLPSGVTVPIVAAAVLFDLGVGDSRARPGPRDAYQACVEAENGPVAEGSVGAGTGATVGKLFGPRYAMKGGLGTASEALPNGTVVGAMVAVNAVGDVVDPASGRIVAGACGPDGDFLDSLRRLRHGIGAGATGPFALGNTTLAVVATDAMLNKEQATKLAAMAQNGLVLAVRPANTMFDGDAVFALATGRGPAADLNILGAVAADVLSRAILRAVRQAESLFGIPAVRRGQVTGDR